MESLFASQLPILLYCQSFMNSVTNVLVSFITMFGEAYVAILLLMLITWCIDKRKGFLLLANVTGANFSMNVLKVIARVPRPFTVYPDQIKNLRASTATGYSFPSGHSTVAATMWGTLAMDFRKNWITISCSLIIVLVGLSRLFLGAHWPMDVMVGILLGISYALFVTPWLNKVYKETERFNRLMILTTIICFVVGLISAILLQVEAVEEILWTDLMEGSAMCSGAALGYYFERKHVDYRVPRKMKKKVLAFVVGVIPALLGWVLIKSIPFLHQIFKFIGYYYLAFYATFVHPVVGVKLGIFGQGRDMKEASTKD